MKFAISLLVLAAALPVSAFAYTFDSDVPADIQTQMTADLNFVTTIQGNGASGLHQQIFGQVDGATYSKFFNSRVTAIGLNDCGNGGAVACVIPFEDSSKMWITRTTSSSAIRKSRASWSCSMSPATRKTKTATGPMLRARPRSSTRTART